MSPDVAFKYGRPLVPAYNLTLFSNRQENCEIVSKSNGGLLLDLQLEPSSTTGRAPPLDRVARAN